MFAAINKLGLIERRWRPETPSETGRRSPRKTAQFSLSMRKDLRKQLARRASDADMTMRAFVLNALKDKGLAVLEDDLADMRKEQR